MIWDYDAIQVLKDEWNKGTSTAEIGRIMGVSKNAIVGKAHRVEGLIGRPTPIRYSAGNAPPPKVRPLLPPIPLPTLPSLREAPPPLPPPSQRLVSQNAPPRAPIPVIAPSPPVAASRPTTGQGLPKSCCWPIGDPGTKDFVFCGNPSVLGKPYCPAHCSKAYVRVRDRKYDAI